MSILESINQPQDLAKLSIDELKQLAEEIRQLIIETVAKTGGHLAPSLGTVELALALHRSYQTPKDKIVWDVGHQAYTHKILTGRRERFATLRQFGGLSGFTRTAESEHDCFGAGHSSTSISSALGLALARDLRGEDQQVVAVIGDGALSGGMAFEALNHCGHLRARMTVVLNDNEMSISENVGAMSRYLNSIITGQFYNQAKSNIDQFVAKIPRIGPRLVSVLERFQEGLKSIIVPGVLFEELGFRYFGPIDGHNLPELLETFRNIRGIAGPVLVHVITRKGKGYLPAEENPTRFHGTGPFVIETGQPVSPARKTYSHVLGEEMCRLAAVKPELVVITPAMASGSGLNSYAAKFPKRFFDVGIAEQHAVTFAAGLARGGQRPVVAVYSTFLQRAIDQVLHDVCLQQLPVVFAIDRAGLVGEDGATHHGLFDMALLRSLPNLQILAPADEWEMAAMLEYALEQPEAVAVRYPRAAISEHPAPGWMETPLEQGRAAVLREGGDLALWAVGNMVQVALDLVPQLRAVGLEPWVINPRFIKPLDTDLLCGMARNGCRMVTLEEHMLAGGFGSAVLEALQQAGLYATPTLCLGVGDQFVEHGNGALLREQLGLSDKQIFERIVEFAAATAAATRRPAPVQMVKDRVQ